MRVAVVGAGVSGLAATKCCLDEGLEPTCFEQSQDIGGLWRYTEHIEAGRPSLYPSVISNTSKEMSAFSDFPFPEHFPVFLPNALLLDYLRRYTEHFSLREHIRFGVTISTTRGAWLLSRVFEHGYPWDMILNTRLMTLIKTNLPGPLSWWLINYKANRWFNHENYGLQPENSWLVREPVLNDDLPSYILTGRITIKPGVKEFKDNSVLFHNCPEEEPIDIVVFCTGYNISFPFLEESIIRVENKHASLYKYVFPAHLQKPTLAVLGLIKPLGAIMPVAEMQARWVSRVFKGLCQLPPQAVMEKEVNERKKNQIQWFGLTFDEVLKTEWLVYLDTLASFIGAKPSVLGLLCTDPWLALTIFFGPCSPYQYRLGGPGRWEGARQAILTQWDRVLKPTRTRVPAASSSSFLSLLTVVGFLLLLAAVIFGFL
ncbi:dimethylaniline monooxygenase [N-oxide-forming] 1 isoform X3 [Onychostruthus taczanowskii]|uniref:dimethylaniline monooxygenase [N-oxide-forming] 1 isoform X3 n=1 Tax=Onychostruthus taczanowskii TaxID=356909 RepID=UPI001B80A84A|nr:dimethylaniline monooxygenase [N-oxide-forming] 1 isoform X3 [Onychostruthus taczanowskii]